MTCCTCGHEAQPGINEYDEKAIICNVCNKEEDICRCEEEE